MTTVLLLAGATVLAAACALSILIGFVLLVVAEAFITTCLRLKRWLSSTKEVSPCRRTTSR